MKTIFHYDAGPRLAARAALATEGFEVTPCPEEDEGRFAALLPDAEVLLHVLKPVTAGVIERAQKLRLIQKIGVGVNTIDLTAARARGITVANMPGTNTPAVAEATVLLMLAALRNLAGLDRACRTGQGWAVGAGLQDRVGELHGRVIGLVGAGMVPHALVPILHGFGARLLYWSPREHPELGIPRRELPALLAQVDILSLHLPLVPDTERLIDRAALARMKPGAILVNTARGGLVDEPGIMDLTARKPKSDAADRQAGAVIEITEEMIEAGADVLLCEFGGAATNHFWSAPDLARLVYQAMRATEKDRG
jgi:phosphoglycerate dehydrogenase-like enzyme